MTSDFSAESIDDVEATLVHDPSITSLGFCPEAKQAALWTMGIWRCMQQLARLPNGPEWVFGRSKAIRLQGWMECLFFLLVSGDDDYAVINEASPSEILIHTKGAEPVTLGPIPGPSWCLALLRMARAVLFCLERPSPTKPIRAIKLITVPELSVSKPVVLPEAKVAVLDWISKELPTTLLDQIYDYLLEELCTAARIAAGQSSEHQDKVFRGQKVLRKVTHPDGSLEELSGYVLLSLFLLEVEDHEIGAIQAKITWRVCLLRAEAHHPARCGRTALTERLPGLRQLGYIEQSGKGRTRLTKLGREWVRESGLLGKHHPRTK